MDLKAIIATLESAIADPTQGLPEEVFLLVSRLTPLVNVDLLIQDEQGRTLLTWRDDEFYPQGWHVPGGIVRLKEPLADRIHAVAATELGATVTFAKEPLAMHEAILPDQVNRGHFLSLLYACKLTSPPQERLRYAGGAPQRGQWMWHATCPDNLLPAQDMYRRFLGA